MAETAPSPLRWRKPLCPNEAQARCLPHHTPPPVQGAVNRPPGKAKPVHFVWGKKEKAACELRGQVCTRSTRHRCVAVQRGAAAQGTPVRQALGEGSSALQEGGGEGLADQTLRSECGAGALWV